ncbi:unnamed protein product [Ixodes persulcatus]
MEAVSAKDTGRAPSARTLAALALAAAALLLVGLVVGLLLYAHCCSWAASGAEGDTPFFALPGNFARLP